MLLTASIVILLSLGASLSQGSADTSDLLSRAKDLANRINLEFGEWNNRVALAAWAYESNITDENLAHQLNVSSQYADYNRQATATINAFPWHDLQDYDLRRQFQMLSYPGDSALPKDKYTEYDETLNRMESTYAKAKICDYHNRTKCNLSLEPEITEIFTKSRDPEELKYIWKAWRDVSGKKIKSDFVRYIELSNEIARMNNFTDMSAFWLKEYEADDFEEQVMQLWQQVRPLYLQIHAYVRRALSLKYGKDIVAENKPIPAHLLGNIWAQAWSPVVEFSIPYPGKSLPDVTDEMIKQGFNATKLFRVAEDFFTSVNLSAMPETFWQNSILEKPEGVELVCHASAWDFYNAKDFRIKQCTRINMEDLLTAHHEMGHIQYFLQYKNQPIMFREGANPGFHEAVGDTIALSASTPAHLKEIGLLKSDDTDMEAMLNHLFLVGLDKIVFLPFAYILDLWRWNVFKGEITPETYNCEWWKLVEEYQGIAPPVSRSEEDFDPGAKYHVVASVEYLRYFVSFVVQFQFHRALCIEAGEYNPAEPSARLLSECNIYGNKKAGNLFRSMLELGSSRPWQDAMEKLTGQRKMDASGLLEYFKPLQDWLEAENEKNGVEIGWDSSNIVCKSKSEGCVGTNY